MRDGEEESIMEFAGGRLFLPLPPSADKFGFPYLLRRPLLCLIRESEEAAPDEELRDRTLVLKKEPLPRKVQLLAAGVKEIRCISCLRVRPIAVAEELGEGWICEDCLSDATGEQKYFVYGGK